MENYNKPPNPLVTLIVFGFCVYFFIKILSPDININYDVKKDSNGDIIYNIDDYGTEHKHIMLRLKGLEDDIFELKQIMLDAIESKEPRG